MTTPDRPAMEGAVVTAVDEVVTPSPKKANLLETVSSNMSLTNPTWDYLQRNFTKVQLQKHCQQLDMDSVWVNKDKLIEFIMEKHRASTSHSANKNNSESCIPSDEFHSELVELKEKLNMKDIEMEEINEMLKKAYITINKLSDRLSALEEKVKLNEVNQSKSPPPIDQHLEPSKKSLFLGDTNLTHVLSSDLDKDCAIRTIKGANVNLIKSWVTEKLNWAPERCFLYCGFQDILDEVTTNDILDSVGAPVTELKLLNENMDICICQLVPSLKADEYEAKINHYNTQLMEWSLQNGVSLIKTNSAFKLGTGDIDEMCYDLGGENSGLFLNRYGIIRLLTTISKESNHFTLRKDWEHVRREQILLRSGEFKMAKRPWQYYHSTSHVGVPSRFENEDNVNHHNLNVNLHNSNVNHNFKVNHHHSNMNHHHSNVNHHHSNVNHHHSNVNHHNPNTNHHNVKDNWRNEEESLHRSSSYTSRHYNGNNNNNFSGGQRQGCYNCGEFNHNQSSCRYDHKIRCASCHSLGHKSKLCNYYST